MCITLQNKVECPYKNTCSGCQLLDIPLSEQQQQKKEELKRLLGAARIRTPSHIDLLSLGPSHLRDRVDLVFHEGTLGLYKKNSRDLVDIEECQQLSPNLQDWLSEVRQYAWPIKKGSLRLRVGPQNQKGIWLDFANIDIKTLLEEKKLLQILEEKAIVEIGQRRKVPSFNGAAYKLKEATPKIWFQTWTQNKAVDLYCSIGSFTQPSLKANRLLVKTLEGWIEKSGAKNILEFGSGIGNLSIPALGKNRRLTACEIDTAALASFAKNIESLSQLKDYEDCNQRLRVIAGDFQNKNPQNFEKFDLVLANPPRSGLKKFLEPLILAKNKPLFFMYMSCFPQTFIEDGQKLEAAGYKMTDVKIVDQFPQTTHYEILSFWHLQ